MAIGVPESDVFAAADAVLARGERPTVERVRLELGRGSPARVGQLLEAWWEALAQRLKGHVLLPELPGEVAQAFAEVWRLSLGHAETTAQAVLTDQQNALFAAQGNLTQERKVWEIALTEAQANVAEYAARLAQAAAQLQERQMLVDYLEAQRTDLLQQRDRLQAHADQQHRELEAMRSERATTQDHMRIVEDRAHQQVDHSRQELKALQQQLERAQREHAKTVAQLSAQQDALRTTLRAAEQTSALQAGQVRALEATLKQWRNVPAPSKRAETKSPIVTKGKSKTRAKRKTLNQKRS